MVLLLTASLAGGCAPPTPASHPGLTGDAMGAPVRLDVIVFSSNRTGRWAVWSIKPDGSDSRQLSQPGDSESDVDVAVSPDGASILFTSNRGGSTGLWRMALDGANPRRICDGDQGEWSPDGSSVVFRRTGQIFIRELATGSERALCPETWDKCSGPSWSPNGREIAFSRLGESGNAIYAIAASGGLPRTIYAAQGACEPHWSRSGDRLVYETETHIGTINPDGTKNRVVTYYGGVQRYGRFNPDASRIVFCQAASPQGPWELYTVPAGGGTPARLTEGGSDMQPDWR